MIRSVALIGASWDPAGTALGARRLAERAWSMRAAGLHVDVIAPSPGGSYIHRVEEGLVVHLLPPARAGLEAWTDGIPVRDAPHLDDLAMTAQVDRVLRLVHRVRGLGLVEVEVPDGPIPGPLPAETVLVARDGRGTDPEPPPTASERVMRRLREEVRARADLMVDRDAPVVDVLAAAVERAAARPRPPRQPAPPAMATAPAVVVLSHDGLAYTRRCIEGILATVPADARVVLVDNASSDGTREWATLRARRDPRLRLLAMERNVGVPAGRNAGVRALRLRDTDVVAFLDNDTEVGPGWWRPFLEHLATHPRTGVVGEEGYRLEPGPTGPEAVREPGSGPHVCDLVVGYCMVVRGGALTDIGPFDEALGLFWHDDDDYCMRAQLAGWEVVRLASGGLIHYGHASSRGLAEIWGDVGSGRSSELSGRNRTHLARKWARLVPAPAIEGVTGPYALVVDGDERLASDLTRASGGRVTAVAVTTTRDGAWAEPSLPRPVPTRPLGEGRAVVGALGIADLARLAGDAVLVVRGGPGSAGRLGGVEARSPDEAAALLRAGAAAPLVSPRRWRRALAHPPPDQSSTANSPSSLRNSLKPPTNASDPTTAQ